MKTPAELFEEHKSDERNRQAEIDAELEARAERPEDKPGPDLVNCKSCGHALDVSEDPDNWQLQCGQCKIEGVPLPKGYEHLIGGPHDG